MFNDDKKNKRSEDKKEKGLFRRFVEKIDKKIKEKAKKNFCCKGKDCC